MYCKAVLLCITTVSSALAKQNQNEEYCAIITLADTILNSKIKLNYSKCLGCTEAEYVLQNCYITLFRYIPT